MKIQLILLLGLIFMFFGCNQNANQTEKKTAKFIDNHGNLIIPDKVEITQNNGANYQFPGTRIFFKKPQRFVEVKQKMLLQKGDDCYIQGIEFPGVSYLEKKYYLVEAFKYQPANNIKYTKDVKLGKSDAYFGHGSGSKPGYEQYFLLFGNLNCCGLLIGEFRIDMQITKEEILEALMTAYIDEAAAPDYAFYKKFDIDMSKSDFKFNTFSTNTFFYTIGGDGNPIKEDTITQINIASVPSVGYKEQQKAALNAVVQQYVARGVEVKSMVSDDVMVDETESTKLVVKGILGNREVKILLILTDKYNTTLIFSGIVFDGNTKYYKQVEQIAETFSFLK